MLNVFVANTRIEYNYNISCQRGKLINKFPSFPPPLICNNNHTNEKQTLLILKKLNNYLLLLLFLLTTFRSDFE